MFPALEGRCACYRPLLELIEAVEKSDHKELSKPQWVERYVLIDALCRDQRAGRRFVEQYLERLFLSFLESYQVLVQTNFPTLRNAFALFSKLPVHVIFSVAPKIADSVRSGWWGGVGSSISYIFCTGVDVRQNAVFVCDSVEFPEPNDCFAFRGRDYVLLERRACSFIDLTVSLGSTEVSPIHSLVYARILAELPAALDLLRHFEGASA